MKFDVYVYVLFPTNISDETEISIEHNGADKIRLNICKGKQKVTLDYAEAKKLAEYINGMEIRRME